MGTLTLLGQGTMPMLGADITPLDVAIQNLDQNILRITIGAAGRWEVPASQLFSNTAPGTPLHCWACMSELRTVDHQGLGALLCTLQM